MHQPLMSLAQPFELTKATATLQRKLNDQIEALNKDKTDHGNRMRELEAMDLAPGSAGAFAESARTAAEQAINLLLRERAIRAEILSLIRACEADLLIARQHACLAHESAMTEVRQQLIEIGYVDGPIPGGSAASIQPGHVFHHPRVFQAKREVERLAGITFSDRNFENEAALRVIDQESKRIRNQLFLQSAK